MIRFSLVILALSTIFFVGLSQSSKNSKLNSTSVAQIATENPMPSIKPLITIPNSHIIPQKKHTFQTFNNCGPAALSMALSYYGINKGQQELGQKLRPYQNPQGDNDDKSVTLEEIAKEAQNYDLVAYHRPNGDIVKLKKLIASDIPVTRTTACYK